MKHHTTPSRSAGRRSTTTTRGFALRPLAFAALVLTQGVQALPTGIQPTVGVQVNQNDANNMVITTTAQKTIINTQTFGIAAQEKLTVAQPGVTSSTMFSVKGYDPSYILGAMQSNGRVFLQNPNGIVFGANARVDVGGLVATTMHLSDTDFMAGRYLLTDTGDGRGDLAGRVINQGTINAPHGSVVLAGREVINSGQILAEGGRVGLIAASKVLVDVEGDGLLFFQVEGKEAGARLEQLGRIEANGGSVELMAASRAQFADTVLNMSGVVQARTLGMKEGRVVIDGGDTGITAVSGTVDVTGAEAGQKGGSAVVQGQRVLIDSTALIDASGSASGGQVRVGGGFHGDDASVRNADRVAVLQGARLKSNALTAGDGGKVVVWSDTATRFYGNIEARGAGATGAGGLVEVSGKKYLDFNGQVDLTAQSGLFGTLLLDPTELTIQTTGSAKLKGTGSDSSPFEYDGTLPPASADTQSILGWDTIKSNLHTGNVKVQTSAGDIFIKDASGDLSENHDLTLQSAANIVQNSGAGMGNGGFGKITLQSGTGSSVFLNADVIFNSGVTIAGPTVLNGNVEIWSGTVASKIDLQGPVTGNGHNLTLTYVGNTAGGEIKTGGAIAGVGNFKANGKSAATTITLGGDVTTTGTQTYDSDVTLGTAVNLRGSTISLSGVNAGANNLGLRADSVSLTGGATGTGTVTFEPSSDTGVISVAGGAPVAAGTLQLSQNLLNKFSGWASVVLGSTANAYKIAVGDFNLPTQIAARSSTGDISFGSLNKGFGLSAQTTGRIDINGVVGGVNPLSSLNANGQIHINTASIKTSGNQSYAVDSGSVKLERATSLDAGGGKIALAGVDGGGSNLTLTSSSTDADAIKTSGAVGSVAVLNVNGKSTLGGDVSTSGTQSYSDAVTLSKTTTSLSGSTVSFAKTVDATADGAQSLNVTGNASFGNNVGKGKTLGTLAVSGATTLNGDVTTTGTQSYNDAVTLSKTATLSGSTVSFAKTVDATTDGAQSLSVTGNANFGGDVGTAKKLGALAVSGTTGLGGNITTTGGQTYGSTTTLSKTAAAYTFTAGTLKFNGLVAGSNDLNFHVDSTLDVSGVLSGTGNVSIAGQTADKAISVGGPTAAADDLEISNSTLALFGPSFGSVTIGRADGTGAITFSNYTLTHNLGVRSGSGDITFGTLDGSFALAAQTGGQIKLTGDVGAAAALSSLNLQGAAVLAPTSATPIRVLTSGRQDYHGSVTLASDATLSGDAGVHFYDTVDGQPAATKPNLVVKASAGEVQFDGSVGNGATAPTLGAIDVTATSTIVNSDMSASVRQTYVGNVTLGNDVTFKAQALSFGNALFAGGNALGLLSDTPVAIAAGNLHGTGSIQIGPYDNATQIVLLGDPLLLSSPGVLRISQADFAGYVDAGFTSIKIGSQSGTGQVDVGATGGAAINLTHDLTVQSGTGAINLQAQINGAHNLTLNTGGVTSINADVGGSTALASLSTDAAGSTHLNANVRTSGNQTYRDAVELGNTVTTTAATTTFASTVDSVTGTNSSLSVNGNAQFGSTVGGVQRLGSLSVTGAAQLAGNVSTTSYQQYSGAVTLNQSVVLDSSGSYIYFPAGSTVDGAHDLTLKSTASYLYGTVGGITPLTSLTVTGATYAMGNITTLGDQSYGGLLTLIGSTALDSGAGKIALGGVTGNVAGNDYNLRLTSTNAAADAISTGGDVSNVATLSVNGKSTLNGNVTTTGTQVYTQGVTLGSRAVELKTTGATAKLDVQGAVDGNHQNLTLTNTANTTDADAIRLSSDVNNVATLVANGRTTVGGDISTSGAQQYQNTLKLVKDTVRLTSTTGAVTIQQLDGATDATHFNALEVTAPGGLTFLGGIANLRGLSVFGSTTTTSFLNGGGLTTTNDQLYEGDVKIAGDATFSALQLRMLKSVSGLSATQQIHNLTLIANQMEISAALAGTGELKVAPSSAGVTMGINGAAGSLQIDLSKVSGFTQRTIGSDHAGDISANAMTLTGDTTIQTGGRVVVDGNVNGGHALTVEAKQGEVEFKRSIDGQYDLTDPAHPKVVVAPLTDLNVTAQTISFAGNVLHTTGVQRFNGDFRALNPFELSAASVSLRSSQALELSGLSLTSGGSIEAQGVLTLSGNVWLGGGELILQSDLHPSNDGVAFKDDEWSAPNKAFTINNRLLREAEAAIEQKGGVITTEAGSRLNLRAPNRGSILIDHSENQIRGDVVAVSGPAGDTDASRFQGSGKLPVSYVRIDADQIHSAGIEADAVKLSTNTLTTAPGTKIRARLPYINAQGTDTSLPALILAPKKPNELNLFGSIAPSTWIQVDVGDAGGGYVTVRTKGLGSGSSTIFLGGPDSATPFYDGTGKVSEIQIYYNGRTPSTPQEVGALNAVTAVIEESRRARFEEVVRTENVSARLRQGVIAEVGSGRPATEGSESIRMPQSCTPKNGLGC